MITIKSIMKTGVICFGFLFFTACKTNDNLTAVQIVERSCEAHGGLNNWKNIKSLSFDKSTRLYNADGSIESDVDQHQLITFSPGRTIRINSIDSSKMSLFLNEGVVQKQLNGQLVNDSTELEKAKRAMLAAEYVIKQPFALLDKGVELTLEGEEDIEGKTYYAISVAYENDGPDADKWTYYFNKNDYTLSYNKVVLADHSSWVENLTYDTNTDFKFNARRKSYRLNEKGEKTYLRAEYYYRNYKTTTL
ncbi:MAG: hypothetical protein KJO49_07945 [Bacteroidia bacterium]|nr:hypothetical protein [Bacteroidia bacterium]